MHIPTPERRTLIRQMKRYGYSTKEVRGFTNDEMDNCIGLHINGSPDITTWYDYVPRH